MSAAACGGHTGEHDVGLRDQPLHRADIGQPGIVRTLRSGGAAPGGGPEHVGTATDEAGAEGGAHFARMHYSNSRRHT
jgi:hypothetical protein